MLKAQIDSLILLRKNTIGLIDNIFAMLRDSLGQYNLCFHIFSYPLIISKKYDIIIRFIPTWPSTPSHPAVVFRTKRGKFSRTGTILPLNLLSVTTRVESCNKMQLWRGVFWKTNTEKQGVVSLLAVEFQEGAKGSNITCDSPAALK